MELKNRIIEDEHLTVYWTFFTTVYIQNGETEREEIP